MRGTVRRLPLRVEPVADEAFASYVARVAAAVDCPPGALLQLLRIAPAGARHAPAGFGLVIGSAEAELVAAATGVDPHAIFQMQMSAYAGTVLPGDGQFGEEELSAAAVGGIVKRWWVYHRHGHACPECLVENEGAWLRRWKLPWAVACVRHGRLLLDTCPGCGRRLNDGCLGEAARRLAGLSSNRTCGEAILATTFPRAWKRLLDAQTVLDDALEGRTPVVYGETAGVRQFFAEMRSLVQAILYGVDSGAVRRLPQPARDAVAHHAALRDERTRLGIEQRRRRADDHAGGARQRVGSAAPTGTALLAAVVPWAVEIATSPSDDELRRRLEPLWKLTEKQTAHPVVRVAQWAGFGTRLNTQWRTFAPSRKTLPGRAGLHYARDGRWTYPVETLPQLIWQPVYARNFRPFMPGIGADRARRHVSICLARMAHDGTWEEVAAILDLDPAKNARRVHALHSQLLTAGTDAAFIVRLHALARALERSPVTINYARRRQVFGDLDVLDRGDWDAIREQANAGSKTRERALLDATAWLWAYITGSDWRLAPSYHTLPLQAAADCRRAFARKYLPQLRPALEAFAAELLRRAGIDEPVEPDLTMLRGRANTENDTAPPRLIPTVPARASDRET